MIAGFVLASVGLLWVYEAVGFWLGWWPTITGLLRPHRDVGAVVYVGCAVIQLVAVWAMLHLYGEEYW